MVALIRRLLRNKRGQGLVEYALVIAIVALGLITALGLLRNSIGSTFKQDAAALSAAGTSQFDGTTTGSGGTGNQGGGNQGGGNQGGGNQGGGKGKGNN
jgi:Flp pilus assembly pilin Flp